MAGSPRLEGTIFQVQRWSIHDGEGIRSTVFLKGCPLRCAWCANPESWTGSADGGQGRRVTAANLMKELRKDEIFYRESGGGVTFSGGEPFAQPEFLRELVAACGAVGYHTAAETSAFFDWNEAADIFARLDAVFVDIKHMDSLQHKKFTGVPNGVILKNVERILATHGDVTVRVPLVAGVNDDEANIRALRDFLRGAKARGLKGVELLPYHNLGVSKYSALGLPIPPEFAAPPVTVVESLKESLRDLCSDFN
jgi:pyruvate formate lyase activating enzyme